MNHLISGSVQDILKSDFKILIACNIPHVSNFLNNLYELSSTAQGEYLPCNEAFLFSMVNPQGLGPTKLPLVKHHEYAMYCDSSLGPTFGGGHDLHTGENADKTASSYNHLGYSYECPPGQHGSFFTGVRNFIVTNYEVYGFNQ